MTPLNRAARDIIAGARTPAPDRAARVRMRAALVATLAPGAALGAAGAGFFASAAGKLLVGAVAAAVGVGTTLTVHRLSGPRRVSEPVMTPAPPPSRVAKTLPPPERAAEPPSALAPVEAPPAPVKSVAVGRAAAAAVPEPQEPKTAATNAAAKATTPPVEERPAPPGGPSRHAAPVDLADPVLREELAVLQRAMAHRDAQEWSEVLKDLDAYHARFSRPTLDAEALMLEALALCGMGRADDARAVAARLAEQARGSPVLRGLAGSCALEERP
ncbi:MAG: hypothetical protein JNK82_20140 [Myxococcaceae bacterium]|nr:hypothetical protein [Myxococcaceae bacterium]